MNDQTRRGFLAVAGTGVAAVGVAAVIPASAEAAPVRVPAGAKGPLVAYVSDLSSGQVTMMVGEHHVVVQDHDLVARLAHAAAAS